MCNVPKVPCPSTSTIRPENTRGGSDTPQSVVDGEARVVPSCMPLGDIGSFVIQVLSWRETAR